MKRYKRLWLQKYGMLLQKAAHSLGVQHKAYTGSATLPPRLAGPVRSYRPKTLLAQYLSGHKVFSFNVLRAIGERKFDLVINSDHLTLAAGHDAALAAGAKRIYDAIELPKLGNRSGDVFEKYSAPTLKLIEHFENGYINASDAITVIGPSFKTWFADNYTVKDIEVVRNCRNREALLYGSRIKKDLKLRHDEKLLLFINGVYKNQGIEKALEALVHLPQNVHLATLGELIREEYGQTLKNIALQLNVEKRFHILRPLQWDKMLAYASGADIGIIPSQKERLNIELSLPNRIFELVMAHIPVATARLPDISEIVQKYNIGMVFDETDPKSIAATLTAMLTDNNLASFKKNLAIAARELCWENEEKKLLGFIEKFFDGKKHLKILFLSRKDIQHNNRIARISRTLTAAGHQMTIIAPYPPGKVHIDRKAEYIIASDDPMYITQNLEIELKALEALEQQEAE